MEKNQTDAGMDRWFIPIIGSGLAVGSMRTTPGGVSIFLCNVGVDMAGQNFG
ncbi:MAG: hypothetical protein P8X55_02320 [Desulfosarcinaceae bacterium]